MSSKDIRTELESFIGSDIPSETNVVDLTNDFKTLKEMLDDEGISLSDNWLGLQFVGDNESTISISSNNSQGCYREFGSLFCHIVAPAVGTPASGILDRAEIIKNAFRGQNINGIIVTGIQPPNFENGATLQFDGGWTSASVIVNFYRDLNL